MKGRDIPTMGVAHCRYPWASNVPMAIERNHGTTPAHLNPPLNCCNALAKCLKFPILPIYECVVTPALNLVPGLQKGCFMVESIANQVALIRMAWLWRNLILRKKFRACLNFYNNH